MVTPTAARMMQATRANLFRQTAPQLRGFVYRENRVPFYQRLFQRHDGKRQWEKSSRSPYILYPFYTAMYGVVFTSIYGACRMVLGHKSWI